MMKELDEYLEKNVEIIRNLSYMIIVLNDLVKPSQLTEQEVARYKYVSTLFRDTHELMSKQIQK